MSSESCRETHVNVYVHADNRMQDTYRHFSVTDLFCWQLKKAPHVRTLHIHLPFWYFHMGYCSIFSYTLNFKLINAALFFLEGNFWTATLNLSAQVQNDALCVRYLCAVLDALRHFWFSVWPMRLNAYGPVAY